eukprot:TRINITY_DN7108_c0_g3_i1.p1 TRINITY_DN7108_c0_g3~~TRINITY_DN7108_c0_g3_i1.p1  ORF type:complete len:451 (+),score=108.84 TRINITY_DN7108_c0_g3_i1:125-1477(+)
MRPNKRMDKPGKYESDSGSDSKCSAASKGSDYSAGPVLKKKRDKILAKHTKRQTKQALSSVTDTPSPIQEFESNEEKPFGTLRKIVECLNSPALPREIRGRDGEKERIAEYLSLYFTSSRSDNTESRTLYICGPPGVGKTATLNYVLSTPAIKTRARSYLFNAMNYKDSKDFLNQLDEQLCKEAELKHTPSANVNAVIFSIQSCLKKLNGVRIVVIDEIDALSSSTRDSIIEIFRIPLYAEKTILIGIANSTLLYSSLLEDHDSYRISQITFEPYTVPAIQSILQKKLEECLPEDRKHDSVILPSALRNVAQSVASGSGDMRIAFDVIKMAMMEHISKEITAPITLGEVAAIMKAKYKSKLGKMLLTLPTSQKMMCAALYSVVSFDHREVFTYKEIYDKVVQLMKQSELERPSFSDFCEGLKMLEFYDLLEGEKKAKVGFHSKVCACANK